MSALPEWITILDSLDLSFIVTDESGAPVYLSSAAAQVLQIRERDNLAAHADTLEPFRAFAERLRPEAPRLGFEPQLDKIEELVISRADGRRLRIVASGRPLAEVGGNMRVILFSDIAVGDTLLRTLASFRRSRPTLVLTSVVARKPVGEVNVEDLRDAAHYLSEEFTSGGTRRRLQRLRCDLLQALTRAIDTVDTLLPESFRIVNEANTSLLVLAPETTWVRLLVHILIETADFAGVFGKVRIAARLPIQPSGIRAVTLGFLAERGPAEIVGGAPIHRYLARQLRPTSYGVSHLSDKAVGREGGNDAETELVQLLLGRDGVIQLRESHRISDEQYSENLRVAEMLAKACGQTLRAQLLTSGMLLFTLDCPLVVEAVSAG